MIPISALNDSAGLKTVILREHKQMQSTATTLTAKQNILFFPIENLQALLKSFPIRGWVATEM